MDHWWEAAAQHREISSVLCDELEGWDREGGREAQKGEDMGIYVYIQLIQLVVQQKLTQQCEAFILQQRCGKTKKKTRLAMKKFKYPVRVKYGQTILANKDYTQIIHRFI